MIDLEKCKLLLAPYGFTDDQVKEFVGRMYLVVGEILDTENKNEEENPGTSSL